MDRRHRAWGVAAGLLVLGVGLSGCFPLDGTTSGDGGAQQNGFGQPTLEVTIAGVHFGPAAPDSSASAQLTSTRDAARGVITSSRFSVAAASTAAGAGCSFGVTREGQDIASIAAGSYLLSSSMNGTTADGTLAASAVETVGTASGSWSCSGALCNGTALVLSTVDATHVEGYLAGTFASAADGSRAQVVCAFYLPWSAYSP